MKNLKSGLDLHKIDTMLSSLRRWLMVDGGNKDYKRFSIRAFDGVYVSHVCMLSKI